MPDKEKSEKRWDNNEAEAISDLMIVILLVSVSLSANSSTKGLHKSILRQHSYIGRQCCVCVRDWQSQAVVYFHDYVCLIVIILYVRWSFFRIIYSTTLYYSFFFAYCSCAINSWRQSWFVSCCLRFFYIWTCHTEKRFFKIKLKASCRMMCLPNWRKRHFWVFLQVTEQVNTEQSCADCLTQCRLTWKSHKPLHFRLSCLMCSSMTSYVHSCHVNLLAIGRLMWLFLDSNQ